MKNLPTVAANFALSADGKVSTQAGDPSLFTSKADKRRLREIRASGDAVLVGASTVAADTMSMGISDPDLRRRRQARGLPPEPLRVIASRSGNLDPNLKVFHHELPPPIVFTTEQMPRHTVQRLVPLADLWVFNRALEPRSMLKILAHDYGVKRVVCEGGPRLFRALAEADLIDTLYLTITPWIFSGSEAPTLTGPRGDFFALPRGFRITQSRKVGAECFLTFAKA